MKLQGFNRILSAVYPFAIGAAAASFPLTPRIYTPVVIIASLIWLMQLKLNSKGFSNALLMQTYLSFAGLYGIQLIGLAYTSQWIDALKELETKSSFLVLPGLILFSHMKRQQLRIVLWMFTCSILGISIYLLCQTAIRAMESGDGLIQFITGYQYQTTYFTAPLETHPTYLSMFASLAALFMLDGLPGARMWQKSICSAGIIFLVYIEFTLLSRGALIGLTLAGTFYTIHRFLIVEWCPRTALFIFAIYFTLVATAFTIIPNYRLRFANQIENLSRYWHEYYPDNSTSLHLHSWKCALSLIGERPYFGYGTGDEVYRLVTCYGRHGQKEMAENRYNAHSEYLSTMLRHGMLGMAVLTLFLASSLRQALRYQDSMLVAVLIIFIVVSLFESTLNVYRGVVFLSLADSLLVRRYVASTDQSVSLVTLPS